MKIGRFLKLKPPPRFALTLIFLALGLLIFVLGLGWITGTLPAWSELLHVVFIIAVLGIAFLAQPYPVGNTRWVWPWRGAVMGILGLAVGLVYTFTKSTFTAWATLAAIFALFLILDIVFANSRKPMLRWIVHAGFALAAGFAAVAIAQIEAKFADEEFFVALQALALAVYWFLLMGLWGTLSSVVRNYPDKEPKVHPRGLSFKSGWLGLICTIAAAAFFILVIVGYQHSFYPEQAPSYPGITADNPFLCGTVPIDPQTYDGQEVYRRLLALVAANPTKSTPEYGMMALGSGEVRWAQTFHDSLLAESRQGLFTGPAGSVKSVQHDASLRVYYYSKMLAAFPGLFTPAEEAIIRRWFAAINRRALTVEPVDWLYAVAFAKWPEGLYENQESGAGLLALLETTGLADPALSLRNRLYLDANPRGWAARFRVTDDAAVYQPEWLDNAYFQSLYTGDALPKNVQHSFEWLLLQALPDGASLKYNHVGSASLDGIAYLGAELTGDDRYLWVAGRTVDYLESQGSYAGAQPGLDAAAGLMGASPTVGSCLLYGDSGLPNQIGPLAPDKIVFRDGWRPDSTYLLLNLRFTGWHRYKATNTITMLYKNGPLVVENTSGKPFAWLPVGRSLFRDKRIPRENLNGLVVARTGMSATLYNLTDIGGLWAQDPPYYARVESFDPSTDTSVTEISGWRGWTQRRTIALHPDGLWVWDDAQGSAGQPAAIVWHFASGASLSGNRVILRGGDHPAEAVITIQNGEVIRAVQEESGLRVEIRGQGQVHTAIVFHFDNQVKVP